MGRMAVIATAVATITLSSRTVICWSNNIRSMAMASSTHVPPNNASAGMKRLVLIGGGHAHVQVIKALNSKVRPEHVDVTLIDIQSNAFYSGMVPGCVSGLYTPDQVQIDLKALARWAGINFVKGKVVGMTLPRPYQTGTTVQKLVQVEVNNENAFVTKDIPFDVVSIDIGSTTRDLNTVPGASRYCISTRPISDLVSRIEIEEAGLKEKLSTDQFSNTEITVVVVGGGAAGIEISLGMRARLGRLINKTNHEDKPESSSKLRVILLDSNEELMPGESLACRTALKNVMDKYKIQVHNNVMVNKVTPTHVHVSSGKGINKAKRQNETIAYTYCIWATGAEAHELSWQLNKQSSLAVSKQRGWILVNKYLQSNSHPYVFAAGDCCEMTGRKSPPKAGVYAVRSGPVLIQNLMRSLDTDDPSKDLDLIEYSPQDDFLKLIMCGDCTALGFRFGLPLYGKWVWELKNHIDLMFMDLFNVDKLVNETNKEEDRKSGQYNTSQYDALSGRPTQLNPDDAAKLLLRTDDDVNFQAAWDVLRDMIASDDYKEKVLTCVSQLNGTP